MPSFLAGRFTNHFVQFRMDESRNGINPALVVKVREGGSATSRTPRAARTHGP